MALLTIENASLGYDGAVVAQGLSFTVHQGDYLCIVGENGSGKSTLVRALLGLHPLLSGTVSRGEDLKAGEIGYLPQQTQAQKDFPASVEEIVLSGCLNRCGLRPFYSGQERRLARQNMERLGISQLARACYRELSGGQQQRVLLARALCAARSLLLLDEPSAGLDPMVSAQMYALIEEINRRDGITVLMVSHDLACAVKYASHILHLRHGQAFFGPVEEYRQSAVGRAFLAGSGGAGDA
ncbi:Zinc import ATP-binding protein ZnuC [bioreactor metagenome]|uniref:Zinc import ATP-binding protein ZnuC n=1 Tax=bioreactor metagenome TaxID=1076179 RepID=A0A645A282_9ZZZZ